MLWVDSRNCYYVRLMSHPTATYGMIPDTKIRPKPISRSQSTVLVLKWCSFNHLV